VSTNWTRWTRSSPPRQERVHRPLSTPTRGSSISWADFARSEVSLQPPHPVVQWSSAGSNDGTSARARFSRVWCQLCSLVFGGLSWGGLWRVFRCGCWVGSWVVGGIISGCPSGARRICHWLWWMRCGGGGRAGRRCCSRRGRRLPSGGCGGIRPTVLGDGGREFVERRGQAGGLALPDRAGGDRVGQSRQLRFHRGAGEPDGDAHGPGQADSVGGVAGAQLQDLLQQRDGGRGARGSDQTTLFHLAHQPHRHPLQTSDLPLHTAQHVQGFPGAGNGQIGGQRIDATHPTASSAADSGPSDQKPSSSVPT